MIVAVPWSERALLNLKRGCICVALMPLGRLAWLAWHQSLGANPIEYLSRATGWWTLTLLLLTLSVTPLRRLTGWHWLMRLRRVLGLSTFAYAVVHFAIYLWLDQFFDWAGILKDVIKRPFITAGFVAFLLLLPLALTSSNAMVRRMGGKRWQWLHRLVYPVAILGVTHYWWLVKKDVREPMIFFTILLALLAVRIWHPVRVRVLSGAKRVPSKVA